MASLSNGSDRPLVSPIQAQAISPSIMLQKPLSRIGHGPGLIIVVEQATTTSRPISHTLDPLPTQKWAEEGYAVAEIVISGDANLTADINTAIQALKDLPECSGKSGLGLISYLTSGSASGLAHIVDATPDIVAAVSYGSEHPEISSKPHLLHVAGKPDTVPIKGTATKIYTYPTVEPLFVLPSHKSFHSSSAAVSHTRSLTHLKPVLGGPYFDLEAVWDEHTLYEFETREVDKTMATMVQEPYVNHVPTLTGGVGRSKLTDFYRNHFIFNNPEDTALELVSRTIGIDRIIDEFIFTFTHDKIIDWLLPGVPPTGKAVRVPFTGVVNIRGDHLYHEHIWWDQASVLVQLGLLPQYLPFPYPINDKGPAPGNRFEYRVPAAGAETAAKLTDENSVESNQMFSFATREVANK